MRCEKCGSETGDTSKFCEACGEPVKKATGGPPAPGKPGGNRSLMILTLIFGVAGIALLIAAGVANIAGSGSPLPGWVRSGEIVGVALIAVSFLMQAAWRRSQGR